MGTLFVSHLYKVLNVVLATLVLTTVISSSRAYADDDGSGSGDDSGDDVECAHSS